MTAPHATTTVSTATSTVTEETVIATTLAATIATAIFVVGIATNLVVVVAAAVAEAEATAVRTTKSLHADRGARTNVGESAAEGEVVVILVGQAAAGTMMEIMTARGEDVEGIVTD